MHIQRFDLFSTPVKITIRSMGSEFDKIYVSMKPTTQGFQIHNQNLILIGDQWSFEHFYDIYP